MHSLSTQYPEKRALVTGAASRIGLALSRLLAQQGWRVALADIHQERLLEAEKLISNDGGTPVSFILDVSSEAGWLETAQSIQKEWGGLDLLINNAGIPVAGFFERIPTEEWQKNTDVNYWGAIHGCRAFIPTMKAQGRGHIVNVSACAGIFSLGAMGPYNVAKAAMIALSETLHKELYENGIRVSVVLPTAVKTNISENKNSVATESPAAANIAEQLEKTTFTADQAAQVIVKGVSRHKLYIYTRFDGLMLSLIKRLMPQTFSGLVRRMFDR